MDISNFSVAELNALVENANQLVQDKRQTEIDTLKGEITKMVDDSPFEWAEVFGGKTKAPKAVKVATHKDENGNTWTDLGRGRKPAWVAEILSAGGNLDDYKI